nr:putative ribonuclease H-like domain-containing protein [Tanacetum cinerariifolium]
MDVKSAFLYGTIDEEVGPTPGIESISDDLQNRNPFVTETGASSSTILSKPAIKFVKSADSPTETKTDKVETAKKPYVKDSEMYRKTSKRFTWTFFLKTKDETSGILRNFITEIKNMKDLKNGVAERRNKTLIEAARTMLADAKLPVTFWAEAVNTACYVQNMVLVNKSQNKTSYELYNGKFEAKGDERYFIGYSMSSKAFRVFNKRTKRVKENLHVDFLENKAIEKGAGPNWLFDIDSLTKSMNYMPVVVAGTNSTNFLGTKDAASQEVKKDVSSLRYTALPNWFHEALLESFSSNAQDTCNADAPKSSRNLNPTATTTNPPADQMETLIVETLIPTVSLPIPTAILNDSRIPSSDTRLISKSVICQDETPSLDNITTLTNRFDDILRVTTSTVDSHGVEADVSNMETTITTSPTLTLRIHKGHPKSQIIGPVDTPIQTKNKSKEMKEQSFIATIHQMTTPDLLQFCLFSCFLSQEEPKKISDALKDPSWVEAMIEAIRLFLAYASFIGFTVYQMDVKSAFLYGTIDEEVYVMQPPGFYNPQFPNKVYKVEKAMYGLHQAPRAWYSTLSKYLLTHGFRRALMHDKFHMSAMGELNFFLGLQVQQKKDGIFLSHDKYVGDILKKFRYSDVKSDNTPMDKENPWGKDGPGKDVELHLYRSMIRSLMYLTASRPDIMFFVCACARHQVTPKECHLYAVKRIFRYLKGRPKLGLWYPRESPFDLVAYSDSDYGGAAQDRKSTTEGCQFLGRRLISWQHKKQTIVATSITETEYVAAASGYSEQRTHEFIHVYLVIASVYVWIGGNSNPTATSKNPPADQMETLTVEYAIPIVSSPILTACLETSLETTSGSRLILKRVISQDETPSLDNISTLSTWFEDILGVMICV